MKLFKSREEREQSGQAEQTFKNLIASLDEGAEQARAVTQALKEDDSLAALSNRQRKKLSESAFKRYVETALADDQLSEDEEDAFGDLTDALGITDEDLHGEYRDVLMRLAIAKANDGRLEAIKSPNIMIKKGEEVHLEMAAALMKEVTIRETRGGSSGVSFRVAKGVRVRTGQFRAKSVVVGTQLQVEDSGILSVTSKRIVFMGSKKTLDVPYTRLLNTDVFNDGIRFHVSGRQNAPLLKLESGPVVAATVNAAFEKLDG